MAALRQEVFFCWAPFCGTLLVHLDNWCVFCGTFLMHSALHLDWSKSSPSNRQYSTSKKNSLSVQACRTSNLNPYPRAIPKTSPSFEPMTVCNLCSVRNLFVFPSFISFSTRMALRERTFRDISSMTWESPFARRSAAMALKRQKFTFNLLSPNAAQLIDLSFRTLFKMLRFLEFWLISFKSKMGLLTVYFESQHKP